MNGLRMFIAEGCGTAAADGGEVFYSRRSDGPYYRWWYDQKHWFFERVHSADLPSTLRLSTWKNIPDDLRVSVTDHYLE